MGVYIKCLWVSNCLDFTIETQAIYHHKQSTYTCCDKCTLLFQCLNYNANIGSAIGYRLLLVASILDIGTCQKPISVHLYYSQCGLTAAHQNQTRDKSLINSFAWQNTSVNYFHPTPLVFMKHKANKIYTHRHRRRKGGGLGG